MDKSAIAKTVTQYMAAWNEPDDTARRTLLDQCWSDSGVYLDPNVSFAGRGALATKIGEVLASRPGARLEFMSGIDVHHHVGRFLWRLVRADGTFGDTSIDFGEVGPDGRLVKIVGLLRCSATARLNRLTP
ncbi:nuclear transport factor 2 family protein [Bradyrhizobium sp. CSA112]|uniref:nuclear transport factor 2 family protein n=1 Tax=Bradyrhizobium sp. CSA112 TaxID=2699170 RepID=UPI0023AFE732|nr:nuclear transport factor 2 family protein [Bradyrhizobium sp. CSA112]